jgi:hypothetical protein
MSLTFLIGTILAFHQGPDLRYRDEQEWSQLSANLVQLDRLTFDGIHSTTLRPPGYVWFLYLPQLFHPSAVVLRVYNMASLLVAQVFLYLLAIRIWSRFAAALAVLMSLFYPVLIYMATLLFPQTLGASMLLCILWLLVGSQSLSLRSAIAAGAISGLLLLAIPQFAPLGGALVLWLLWKRSTFRRRFVYFLLPFVLLVGGWCARNYAAVHSFVFISCNGGANFLFGYSENSTVNSGSYTDITRYSDVGYTMPEGQMDRYFKSIAMNWIRNHPGKALYLYTARLAHYFDFVDAPVSGRPGATTSEKLAMYLTYGPLLVLLVARIALAAKYPLSQTEVCLAGLYLLDAFFASMFYPRIRYRLPLDWLLIALDAGTIQLLLTRVLKRADVAAL